jgi:2-polyprenyl-6-methoxyphenol hydroxylase-like FAD-dependent oxidoreductase
LWYPCGIAERASFLKSMYEQLRDKSKIQLKKKVIEIKHGRDSVKVVCADGTEFNGSIVVGADGIHSKVREEMQREAETAGSGIMAEDKFSKWGILWLSGQIRAERSLELSCFSQLKEDELIPLR